MSGSLPLLTSLLIGAFLLWRLITWARRPAWLPLELRKSRVFSREKTFSAVIDDFHLFAKPDRVYRLPDGRLCVTEYKVRNNEAHVHRGDIWQVSAGAAALAVRHKVAEHGWVIVENRKTRQRQAHRVDLLSRHDVGVLMQRYTEIESGSIQADRTISQRKCNSCGHKDACHAPS